MTLAFRADRDRLDDVLAGYVELALQRVEAGWRLYLVTMMFDRISGRSDYVLAQMRDDAEHFYRRFVTRVDRRPGRGGAATELPVLIVVPDAPVGKSGKSLRDVRVNDGLHLHGVLLVRPVSRLRVPVHEHVQAMQSLYVNAD